MLGLLKQTCDSNGPAIVLRALQTCSPGTGTSHAGLDQIVQVVNSLLNGLPGHCASSKACAGQSRSVAVELHCC